MIDVYAIGVPELVILVLVLGLLWWLSRDRGARFRLGAVLMIGGIVAIAYGYLGLQQISDDKAALGPARLVAQQLTSMQQRTNEARAEMLVGAGAMGLGVVLLAWAVYPEQVKSNASS